MVYIKYEEINKQQENILQVIQLGEEKTNKQNKIW